MRKSEEVEFTKRLERINSLLERYYESEDSFEQTDLAIEIIQSHVNWLIEQVKLTQGMKKKLSGDGLLTLEEQLDHAKEEIARLDKELNLRNI